MKYEPMEKNCFMGVDVVWGRERYRKTRNQQR